MIYISVDDDDDDGKVGIIHKDYQRQVWGNYHGKLASLGDPGPINMKCPYSGSIGHKNIHHNIDTFYARFR